MPILCHWRQSQPCAHNALVRATLFDDPGSARGFHYPVDRDRRAFRGRQVNKTFCLVGASKETFATRSDAAKKIVGDNKSAIGTCEKLGREIHRRSSIESPIFIVKPVRTEATGCLGSVDRSAHAFSSSAVAVIDRDCVERNFSEQASSRSSVGPRNLGASLSFRRFDFGYAARNGNGGTSGVQSRLYECRRRAAKHFKF